jgi:hypothetical protein
MRKEKMMVLGDDDMNGKNPLKLSIKIISVKSEDYMSAVTREESSFKEEEEK